LSHFQKVSVRNSATEPGIQIVDSEEQQENRRRSMSDPRNPNPNEINRSRAHEAKQSQPIVSTEAGTQMDTSDEQQPNADLPIRRRPDEYSKETNWMG
jgi:hypothetical protein